jgi:hypothetical protein
MGKSFDIPIRPTLRALTLADGHLGLSDITSLRLPFIVGQTNQV